MIADMLSNKKPNLIVTELFIRGRKQRFYCFYYTVLLFCAKNTKFYAISYYENSRQTRVSSNCK